MLAVICIQKQIYFALGSSLTDKTIKYAVDDVLDYDVQHTQIFWESYQMRVSV